jgi:type VI secretion system protein ImpF
MAELTAQERLQPSLLDRLTDDEPESRKEPRERRVLSLSRLRRSVIRDLAWLLNTGNLESLEDLEGYPEVSGSVLNYGLPDIAGSTSSGTEVSTIEKMIRQTIQDFEPRILRNSVRVHVTVDDEEMNRNALTIEIEGELWAQPVPEHLFLKTEVDLETGHVAVKDYQEPA